MSKVRKRVRRFVLVGIVTVLLALFGSTAVGAANVGYAGRLGGDFARGISSVGSTGVSGVVNPTGSRSLVSGGYGHFSSGGGGGTSSNGPKSITGPFSSEVTGVAGPGGAGTVSSIHSGH